MPARRTGNIDLASASAVIRAAAEAGLRKAAEHVLEESRRVAPIEEDTLIRSGNVSVDAVELKAAVSYNTKYAVRQHEELTWRHDPGRQAKYLEGPMNAEAPIVGQIIAAEIRVVT
ncbi:hypothetical protein [Enterococcus hirae]|uniref:hypothetical protein n=1 Tax=Enterococcus hirae TaxID=1354 RepID=UPI001369EB79|nr:hypothetical protein [Enterococcus hirae]NAE18079.1 hypothetical protein [Enterococcus hirae]